MSKKGTLNLKPTVEQEEPAAPAAVEAAEETTAVEETAEVEADAETAENNDTQAASTDPTPNTDPAPLAEEVSDKRLMATQHRLYDAYTKLYFNPGEAVTVKAEQMNNWIKCQIQAGLLQEVE